MCAESVVEPSQGSEQRYSGRFQSLDAMRGLAAVVVMLWHGYAASNEAVHQFLLPLTVTPLRIFINGPAAVLLFFVLSGFVLALPYFHGGALSWRAFITRRICRIYLPYIAALFLAGLLYTLTHHAVLQGYWIKGLWDNPSPYPLHSFLEQFFLTGVNSAPDFILDGPSWSLVHEMRLSLIFPLLIVITQWRWCVLFVVCLMVVTYPGLGWGEARWLEDGEIGWFGSLYLTAYVAPCFILGIFLAQNHLALRIVVNRLSRWTILCLWCVGFIPFYLFNGMQQRMIIAVASGLLIILTLSSGTVQKTLSHAFPAWLGKISYSLYLLHVPIMLATIQLLDPCFTPSIQSNAIILVLSMGLSLLLATVFQRFVEQPMIQLGKKLSILQPTNPMPRP
jgi:peptidoglycan/LPS O-acetylase OafA/YrhL